MRRPYVTTQKWTWLGNDETRTPGISLMRGAAICAHLTPAEARTLADRLHDMADNLEPAPNNNDPRDLHRKAT